MQGGSVLLPPHTPLVPAPRVGARGGVPHSGKVVPLGDRETKKKLDDVLVVTAQAVTAVFLVGVGVLIASAVVAGVRFLL